MLIFIGLWNSDTLTQIDHATIWSFKNLFTKKYLISVISFEAAIKTWSIFPSISNGLIFHRQILQVVHSIFFGSLFVCIKSYIRTTKKSWMELFKKKKLDGGKRKRKSWAKSKKKKSLGLHLVYVSTSGTQELYTTKLIVYICFQESTILETFKAFTIGERNIMDISHL